ncbi:MAG: nucleotidyltransferase family protein [Smithella sp.]
MINSKNFTALILCAGRSSRMGKFKPLLPFGPDNFLSRIISLYRSVDIEDILVVLGHEADRVIPVLDELEANWIMNENYDRGMFSSIQTGVCHLKKNKQSRAFFIHPADIPFVHPDTIKSLIAAFNTGKIDVCRPCYNGRYGHPPLICNTLHNEISQFNGEGGLRALLARYTETSWDVYCSDPGILLDIDTPEDYERALKTFSE